MAPAEVSPVCAFGDGVQDSCSLTVLSHLRFLILICVLSVFFTFFTLKCNNREARSVDSFPLNLYLGARQQTTVGALEKTLALKFKDDAQALGFVLHPMLAPI